MHLIGKHLLNYHEQEDILGKSLLIQEKKNKNKDVINATLGVLRKEDGALFVLKTVDHIMKHLPEENFYPYADTTGIVGFEEALLSYLFEEHLLDIKNHLSLKALPTPGATGALSTTLCMHCDPGDTILLPAIGWNVYENMAASLQLNVEKYDYIKDFAFDFEGFKSSVFKVAKKQKRMLFVLNDPCNNPTGYSLSIEEFKTLLAFMKEEKQIEFTMIYDIAYFEYARDNDSREKFKLLKDLPENVFCVLAFSASKAFTLYGLRLGAMVCMHANAELVNQFYAYAKSIGRTRWSCVATPALHTIKIIEEDRNLKQQLKSELTQAREFLFKRVIAFEEECKNNHIPMIPYRGGFFVAIPCENPKELTQKLELLDVYVLPFHNVIRIAICSISLPEITMIVRRIKKCL